MKTKLIWLFMLVSMLGVCGGCTVVKGAPDTTTAAYRKLGGWKDQATKMTAANGYAKIHRVVNVWIEAKAKEVELASNQYFEQVDLTPPGDVDKQVTDFLATGPANLSVWDDILNWLVGEYKKGRVAEGASTSAGLKDYEWPAPATQPAKP